MSSETEKLLQHKSNAECTCTTLILLSSEILTGKKSHLRKTSEKKPPTKESIAKLQQSAIWKMENDFYEFALEQFQFVRAHAVREKDGELYLLAQNFFYEKIYPKNWRVDGHMADVRPEREKDT